MIKVGIIGMENMGTLHGKLLAKNPEAKVAAVTDLDPERAKAAAALFGCRAYGSVEELLGSGIDMVFITVPNTAHAPLAVKALERGLDVFTEKPLAVGLEDARKVKEARDRSGKRVFVGLNRRFAPVYLEARRLVTAPSFRAAQVNIIQNDGDMANPPWLTDIKMTGGFIIAL